MCLGATPEAEAMQSYPGTGAQRDEPGSVPRPWLSFYGNVPASLDYPRISLFEAIERSVRRFPDRPAFHFLGTTNTYRQLGDAVGRFSRGLAAAGLKQGDRITIALPTCPQALIAFYAAIRLGAVPVMVHPLSTAPEIAFYLRNSGSRFAVTLDAFYGKVAEARRIAPLDALILARIPDYLTPLRRIGFWLKRGRKIAPVPKDADVIWWAALVRGDAPATPHAAVGTDELAVILYSGGTTAQPKGVMLSHRNLITEGMAVLAWVGATEADRVLAVLPVFHGFGLSGLINAPLMRGAQVILVPIFSAAAVAGAIRQTQPAIIAGVPTLFDALTRDSSLQKTDLSAIRAAFSGGDSLPRPIKERFEQLVEARGGRVRLLEGYGLTEAVTAVLATPLDHYREGSIGIPLPDILAKICLPGTDLPAPDGDDGEICIAGPALMMGYLDDAAGSADALRVHRDGRTWLHTGDLGRMDADGFFYFAGRLKQLIKTSGMSVYPRQVEEVLYQHPAVLEACVIGIPDPALGERVTAVIVPKPGSAPQAALHQDLLDHCQERLIKWSCPREIVFRTELPKTLVGKIDIKAVRAAETASRS